MGGQGSKQVAKDRRQEAHDLMMRSAWDTQRDLEIEYQVWITISIEPTNRRGVYKLLLVARRQGDADGTGRFEQYSVETPGPVVGSLDAQIYRALNIIARQLPYLARGVEEGS